MRHPKLAPSCLALTLALAACSDRVQAPSAPDDDAPSAAQLLVREGYLGPAETRKGWIFGRDGKPMEVTYELRNGRAIWDGDIMIGRVGQVPATREALLVSRVGPQLGRVRGGVVIDGDSHRWPNGVVPFEIEAGLPNQARITNALAAIELAVNGVTFVPRTTEDDWIRFIDADGCSSPVGRDGGRQDIELGDGCSTGNAMHEVLHSLGMYHEHTRCDRDAFVTINWDNIEDGREHNFEKKCDDATDMLDYDVGSIMHYGATAFSINDQPTIVLLSGDASQMGQRAGLSDTDIATINALYGAFNDAPTAAIAPLSASYDEGASVAFDGSASSDPDDAVLTYAWDFGDGSCAVTPAPAACSAESPTHTYVDNGMYTVTLTVSDGYATGATNRMATIVNVAPTVNAGADVSLVSGQMLSFSGTFSDPGLDDDPWSWEIAYGFGTNATGSTNNQFAAITDSRRVCAAGTYNVVLSVTDKDLGVGTDALTLTVPYFGVSIDITPTQHPNAINPDKKGLIPVAILSSATFDATSVDPATLLLGNELGTDTPVAVQGGGRYHAKVEDANGDGLADLVVMFAMEALVANGDLAMGTTQLVLRAFLADGCTNVRGADAVTIVP